MTTNTRIPHTAQLATVALMEAIADCLPHARMTGTIERIITDQRYGTNFFSVLVDKEYRQRYGVSREFQFWDTPVGLSSVKKGDHVEVALSVTGQPLAVTIK